NSKLSERFISHKNTESSATHFHRGSASEGRAVLTNKVVKNFMLQTLHDIDIRGSASKDPAYASQTREAILSAVYSKYKDQYCNLLISKGIDIAPFLKEIGEAAQNAGLPGATKNDVFTPSGAGANPFITPLITSAYSKYPHMFTSQHQKASFNIYAEKIIMTEVVPLFNECAMPTPQQFQQILENIANKYIQNAP
ncbi:type III secretion system guanine nucleotide exchange factor SopE2, partial [Salmonella enterica]|nr:type III secretion system guanine nucleotide exchange factor SopE2 [Salmonella enterica]EDZ1573510.1 type III secretion system guanine nucleotide exchange factor SopE2 [Salmonella enterica]